MILSTFAPGGGLQRSVTGSTCPQQNIIKTWDPTQTTADKQFHITQKNALDLRFLLEYNATINKKQFKSLTSLSCVCMFFFLVIWEADFLPCITYRTNTADAPKRHILSESVKKREKADCSLFPLSLSPSACLHHENPVYYFPSKIRAVYCLHFHPTGILKSTASETHTHSLW